MTFSSRVLAFTPSFSLSAANNDPISIWISIEHVMSGLEALALACNVIQVAEFGCKVAGLCKTAHEQGQARPDLEKLGKSFDNAHEALEKSLVQDDILGELKYVSL